jgi:hypothetical protein
MCPRIDRDPIVCCVRRAVSESLMLTMAVLRFPS